jgi:hypothetical protein
MEKFVISVEPKSYLKFKVSGNEADFEIVKNLKEATTFPDYLTPQKILNAFLQFKLTDFYEFDIVKLS